MEEVVFTPAAVLDLLAQIEELQSYDVGVSETPDGLQVQIGESVYMIPFNDAKEIEVSEDVAEEISELNDSAYEDIAYSNETSDESVEAGLIKELVKTLLVGGVARLVKGYLNS